MSFFCRRDPRRSLMIVVVPVSIAVLGACGTTVPQASLRSSGDGSSYSDGLSVATGNGLTSAEPGEGSTDGTHGSATANPAAEAATLPQAPASPGVTASQVLGATQAPGSPKAGSTVGAAKSGKAESTVKATSVKNRVSPSGSAVPSTTTTAPLTVGFTYDDDNSINAELGVNTGTTITVESSVKAFVAAFNASGGLDGRHIVPVYDAIDSSNGETEAQLASDSCQDFTQDNHVDVVLDSVFGPKDGFESCMQQANVAVISDGGGGDAALLKTLTLQASPEAPSLDEMYSEVVKQLVATGYTTKKNIIGIATDSCSNTQSALKSTIVPLINQLGLTVGATATADCPTGDASLAGDAAQITNAVLTFREDKVDRVLIVSADEAVGSLLFAEAANQQQYYPGYMLSSGSEMSIGFANFPSGQQPQIHGVGNFSPLDVATAPQPPTATEQRCTALVTAGGATPMTWTDNIEVYPECGAFMLLDAALKADGAVATGPALIAGIHALGTTFLTPGTPADATDFTNGRTGGASEYRVFADVPSCSCIQYTSGPLS